MILVAIGANLPDCSGRPALGTCVWALSQLAMLARVERMSRWYRTAPVPPSGQPDYINGVIRLHGSCDAFIFLTALHAIEAQAGRVRAGRVQDGRVQDGLNAARVLDLDLLAVDALVVDAPGLIVPHPRLSQRAFVLAPLCDVAPEWRHPVLGKNAMELLASVDQTGVSLAQDQAVD